MISRFLVAFALVGCAATPRPAVVHAVAPPPVAPAAPSVRWPVAMRVLTWTDAGVREVGVLPDAPPTMLPTTPWYVEPVAPVRDRATIARIVTALRDEQVPGLSLRGQDVTAWFPELTAVPSLTALVLDDTATTPAQLQAIAAPLTRLYLARTRIDTVAVIALAAQFPQLAVLDLEETEVDDRAMTALATLRSLRAVNLAETSITDAGGAALVSALPALEVIDLGRTEVGERTARAIAKLPVVRQLFLDDTRITGKAVRQLAPLAPTIARLDLSRAKDLRDADVAWLAQATQLWELRLSETLIGDATVRAVAPISIRELALAKTKISNAGIAILATRTLLEELDLAETVIDDAHAAPLLVLPALRMIRLDKTAVGDRAIAAASPTLRELYLSSTRVTDAGLAVLDTLHDVEALGLGNTQVGAATLERIARHTTLRVLVLSRCTAPRSAFAALAGLSRLSKLYLDRSNADDQTLAALTSPELRVLHLADTAITDAALPTLRGFTELEELTLDETRLSTEVVQLAWPRLHTLSLGFLLVGDADLPAIARMVSLRALDLSGTDISDPSALAALPNLRLLGLAQTRLSVTGRAGVNTLVQRGVVVVR